MTGTYPTIFTFIDKSVFFMAILKLLMVIYGYFHCEVWQVSYAG